MKFQGMRAVLSKLIGVRDDQVEDALQDERRAKQQLSRRGLLLAGAAVAADHFVGVSRAYSFPVPNPYSNYVSPWTDTQKLMLTGPLLVLGAMAFLKYEGALGAP